jgi:hypothetical protein
VLADGPAEVVHCGFPRDDNPGAATIPMRLFKRQGTNAWFLAVYRLATRPDEDMELTVTPAGSEQVDITLRTSAGTHRHRLMRF